MEIYFMESTVKHTVEKSAIIQDDFKHLSIILNLDAF